MAGYPSGYTGGYPAPCLDNPPPFNRKNMLQATELKNNCDLIAKMIRKSGFSLVKVLGIAKAQGIEVPYMEFVRRFHTDGTPRKVWIPVDVSHPRSDTGDSKWENTHNHEPRYDRMFRGRLGRV